MVPALHSIPILPVKYDRNQSEQNDPIEKNSERTDQIRLRTRPTLLRVQTAENTHVHQRLVKHLQAAADPGTSQSDPESPVQHTIPIQVKPRVNVTYG